MAPIVLSLLQDDHATGVSAGPGLGCVGVLNAAETFYSERDELSSLALIMLSVLIADGLLIHQTWVAIAPIREEGLINFGRKSLLQVLYRNETRYFTVTSILVSQFLLELQATDKRMRAGGSQLSITNSRISSVVFHRVVGSIRHVSLTSEEEDHGGVSGESLFGDLAEEFVEEGKDGNAGKVVPDARECSSPTQIVEGIIDKPPAPLGSEAAHEV
ncbi:hypothetical protein V8D89_012459 [Ganoderma adspersum]